jgi:CDGSH-type Zn-finger protein
VTAIPDLPPGSRQRDDVTIQAYDDGPLIVRGPAVLLDSAGREVDPGRRTVALCRCGRSALKPFCDGSHRVARFRAAGTPAGEATCLQVVPDLAPAAGRDGEGSPGVPDAAG